MIFLGCHGIPQLCPLRAASHHQQIPNLMYYHYMGNAKKSINIFYSLNKVMYSPWYAFADWEEGNTPPKIYVQFLSAHIQSTEDF